MGKSFDNAKITGRTVKEDLREALGVDDENVVDENFKVERISSQVWDQVKVQKAPEAEKTEEEQILEEDVNDEEAHKAEDDGVVRDKRWHMHIEASPEEKAIREAEGRTRGRKGCKIKRINMAFKTPVYDYIFTMAVSNGKTLTQTVNSIIEKAIAKDKKYLKLKAVLEEDDEED